jgi:hypothetical protein
VRTAVEEPVDPASVLATDPVKQSFLLNPVVQRVLWFAAQQMKNDPAWTARYHDLRDTLHQHPETFVQNVFSATNALGPRADRSSMASLPPDQFLAPPTDPFGFTPGLPALQPQPQPWQPQQGALAPAGAPALPQFAYGGGPAHAALPFNPAFNDR